MEAICRTVQRIGNGGHVYLPKETVGSKVMVILAEKTMQDIEQEIISILGPCLRHVQGIYLHGSYARREQTPESDIDILVITDNKAKIKKRTGRYEILAASMEQIEKTIKNNAVLILPILKEAKPILNHQLIEKYKKERLTKKNARWYIETTESSLKLAGYLVDHKDIKCMPAVVYPLVMRLRGLCLIESLIHDKEYSNKGLIERLTKKGISPDKARQIYRMYREHRDNKSISCNSLDYRDISGLYDIVCDYYKEVRSLWEKLD